MRAPKRYFREMTERQPRDERERGNVKFSGNFDVLNGKSPLDGWRAEFCSPYGDLLMVLSRLSQDCLMETVLSYTAPACSANRCALFTEVL